MRFIELVFASMGTVYRVACIASLVTGVQLLAPVVTSPCAAMNVQQNVVPSKHPHSLEPNLLLASNPLDLSQGRSSTTLDDYEPPEVGSPGGSGGGSGTR